MFARRYSGRVKVVCQFRDKESDYACALYVSGEHVGDVYVGLPGAWWTLPEYRGGVDSDEAFDAAARAALVFAMHDDEDDDGDDDGEGPLIDSGDVDWSEDSVAVRRRPRPRPVPSRAQRSFDFGRRRP